MIFTKMFGALFINFNNFVEYFMFSHVASACSARKFGSIKNITKNQEPPQICRPPNVKPPLESLKFLPKYKPGGIIFGGVEVYTTMGKIK